MATVVPRSFFLCFLALVLCLLFVVASADDLEADKRARNPYSWLNSAVKRSRNPYSWMAEGKRARNPYSWMEFNKRARNPYSWMEEQI